MGEVSWETDKKKGIMESSSWQSEISRDDENNKIP